MKFLRVVVAVFPVFFSVHLVHAQRDDVGSGRAIEFDGVDDYIDFGDRYSDLTFPFTISAWVHTSSGSVIFASRNNNPLYNGFWFFVRPDFIFVEYGDGRGGNYPAYRSGKMANVTGITNRWNHITAVVRGHADIDLYLNGVNVGGYPTGDSNLPMDSNVPGGHSTAGYLLSNGVQYFFNGTVDDIRLWHRALGQEEVRRDMCVNLTGNEPGLIGYWDFNETSGNVILDKSPNKFNGQFVGNPKRVFSGAPIGDVSKYLYSSFSSGGTLTIEDGDHVVTVKNMKGFGDGVHLYEVKNSPSQTTGLNSNQSNNPYFGVFLVSQDRNVTFDAEYYYKGDGSCTLFSRGDNSEASWNEVDNPIKGKYERAELLKGFGSKVTLNFGDDYKTICDQTSYQISTGITDPEFTFLWSTGETTSSILVNQTGMYSVKVFSSCGVAEDSVSVNFRVQPNPISLGDDKIICGPSHQISTGITDSRFTFLWNTGQTTPSIIVNQSGVYSVKVFGSCGDMVEDSVAIDFPGIPAPVSLGDDYKIVCNQSSYPISTGVTDPQFTFLWNTGQTTSSILANQSGVYSVKVFGHCGVVEDSVTINFQVKPEPISLGPDKIICDEASYQISAGITNPQFAFQWSTGQTTPSITVTQSGLYSVRLVGFCGIVADSVEIKFREKPQTISLGDDEQLCEFIPRVLQPANNSEGLTFLWQDGSDNPTFEAREFGQYWVTVKNSCGQVTDSVAFSDQKVPIGFIPNVITPNQDGKNDNFTVSEEAVGLVSILVVNRWGKEVYNSPAYDNKWDGDNLPSGVYFVLLEGACGNKVKGSLTIIR